jgi:hypothetical protein
MGERIRNLVARSVVTASLLSGQQDVLETTEHETEIEATVQYIDGTATFVRELSNTCTALVKSTMDRANSLDTFADAIFGWCLAHRERFCPNTTNPTVEAFRKVNEFVKYVSKAEHKKADQELEQLEHSLQDLHRRVQAIQKALASRKEYQVRYTARVQQVGSRKNALVKAQTNPRGDKITQAQLDLANAQAQADKARHALLLVTERVLREMNRVQGGLDDQLRVAIADYAKIQVQHMQLMQDGWTKFIPHVIPNAGIKPATTNGTTATASAPPPASAFPPPATAPLLEAAERAFAENDLNLKEESSSSNLNKKDEEQTSQVIVGV